MKKALLLIMSFTLVLSLALPAVSDARRGGYKAPKRSYSEQPSKPADNVNKSQTGTTSGTTSGATTSGAAGAAGANRSFFSGGSLAKGLMIGGIAGLLFGGMFASLGGFGDFLGLLVNVLAIYLLFIAARGIFRYFQQQRRPDPNPNDPYNRNPR